MKQPSTADISVDEEQLSTIISMDEVAIYYTDIRIDEVVISTVDICIDEVGLSI